VRSTVYDRYKKTGLMTGSDHPLASQLERAGTAASAVASQTGLPAAAAAAPVKSPLTVPTPDEDTNPVETAEPEEEKHHGTTENPLDLVDGKVVVRLDSGELVEISFNSATPVGPESPSAPSTSTPSTSSGSY